MRKPCPFCGCEKISIQPTSDLEALYSSFWGQCKDCMSEGPPKKTREEAEEAWNERITFKTVSKIE